MKSVLIANRGEIAVRIARACREMGISPLAVYSEADAHAVHVSECDAAVCIGGSPAVESYLRGEAVIEAARRLGADAVHPGYGFLSENARFARECNDAGLVWIGPPAEVIRRLGDKIAAKQLMQAAGVPVVPGYSGDDQSDSKLAEEAGEMGWPILIKASAGGGGRGMRVVRSSEEFGGSLAAARAEAKGAFGDDRVLLERYIERPHHVEVQIFGDAAGRVVHLFERECSIQRRHQKIVEESPSPVLTPEMRDRITSSAVQAGAAAGYVNAGTVEFLVDPPDFYFLEVNTRLQVEHPVTEAVTGLDLVRLQFLVAEGHPLPFTQEQVASRGHAIEARIYAEDASWLPSIGRLAAWAPPEGPGVRVDSGVTTGSDVSPYYDSMLAKLIVHGESRAAAIGRLERALRNFHVLGVETNVAYLLAIVRDSAFRAGDTPTSFLAERMHNWRPERNVPEEVLLGLGAQAVLAAPARSEDRFRRQMSYNHWPGAGAWRNA
jgi:3-methylcrotonyl-CoA carboxylase alpha subunit